MSDAQTTGVGKMQFAKDVGGKLIVAVLIGVASFLWGAAQEKGALTRQVEVNTGRLTAIEAELKEFRQLKVEISELRGDLREFRGELKVKRR